MPTINGIDYSYLFNPFTGSLQYVPLVGIGGPISGGTANSVLFIDSSGNLAQEPSNFFYTPSTDTLNVVGSADGKRLILRANGTQTANIFEAQDNSSNVLAAVLPGGALYSNGPYSETTTVAGSYIGNTGGTSRILLSDGTAANNFQLENNTSGFRLLYPGVVVIQGYRSLNKVEINTDLAIGAADGSAAPSRLYLRSNDNSKGIVISGQDYSSAGTLPHYLFQKFSSTGDRRNIGSIDTIWATSTDATRKGRMIYSVYDTAPREAVRLEADGSYGLVSIGGAATAASTTAIVTSPTAAYIGLVVKGASSQSGNLQEWQNNSGVKGAVVTANREFSRPFGVGANNEAFGAGAGNDSATGADNTVLGQGAGTAITSGLRNVMIGASAGSRLTTGDRNILIGWHAGIGGSTAGNITGQRNIAISTTEAFYSLTSGSANTTIGGDMSQLTTGSSNTGAGGGSLSSVTVGNSNVAFGASALVNLTTGSSNIGFGNNTGQTISDANYNICIGEGADVSSSAVTDSLALGRNAIASSNEAAFGPNLSTLSLNGLSSTAAVRAMVKATTAWVDSTDATRRARGIFTVYDTAARECVRLEASGSAAMLSFFGVSAVVQQSGDISTGLSNLGLVTSGTLAGSSVTGTVGVANGGTGSAIRFVDSIALTNQGADITTTNFTHGNMAGTYLLSYSVIDTTSDLTAGAITLTIAYTDEAGATTKTANQVLTGTGRTDGVVYIRLSSGNISYAISHTGIFGSAKYALYIDLQRIS